jgi:flagella basal body P-ring formation protein FlgA
VETRSDEVLVGTATVETQAAESLRDEDADARTAGQIGSAQAAAVAAQPIEDEPIGNEPTEDEPIEAVPVDRQPGVDPSPGGLAGWTLDLRQTVASDMGRFYRRRRAMRFGGVLAAAGALANSDADAEIQQWYRDDVATPGGDDLAVDLERLGRSETIGIPLLVGGLLVGLAPEEGAAAPTAWLRRTARAYLVGTPSLLYLQTLTGGYLTSPEALIGQRLKQQLTAGRIITPQVLQADNIIRRGQSVTLIATAGGINVTMSGKSLMDGALNQRIRAENLSSGRVIEGIVRSREHVEILLPESSNYFHAKPKGLPASADTQVSNNDR